ncbi:MetQ/NlpA family ABC transporter substrate-binding protein [Sporosarcina sp. HYO08]|uniref:MetQ/NlpA family ABC transporter substrate-binding protein n=1 Tax=Sporosarcina sp. HYO08 TaxID=1759557 RepID=UPI000798428C|nr:MetQ/NlpA family ABC transporter substrate-binding protein [Sporosarcina sp. HYO08]KXH81934.1 hypothetical protein AU377_06645 [Sporosarcina sp. HYO08]
MKKIITSLLLVVVSAFLLAACGNASADDEKKIKIGATAGPYSDQLKEGIIPLLEADGYKVQIVEFNDYIQPNKALDEKDIDANLFQNRIYLTNFNDSHGMDLDPAFAVPTAPIALYSEKHTSLDDVKEGMTVTLPNDPTNLARSLHMLEGYGWIKVNPDVEQTTASEKDIIENKYNLKVQPLDAAATPRSLSDADFAFVNGNFALASGLKLEEAVDVEKTPEDFLIYMTIRKEDAEKPFAKALKAAYESDEFLQYTNENSKGYVKPAYQLEKE